MREWHSFVAMYNMYHYEEKLLILHMRKLMIIFLRIAPEPMKDLKWALCCP
jgi:hypothetical protein